MAHKNRYPLPTARPLRVYAYDPSAGRRVDNYVTIPVPYEALEPGPIGKRLAVIDYDATNEKFYEPVDLDHHSILMHSGLDPSESDPRFHQQMVYAVASRTIEHFERALGRPIRWRHQPGSRRGMPFHGRLRIFPHAFQQANAFYDAELSAVLFGYYAASQEITGEALPGQTVFTCLSHDIIAHEMTHAVIDGQREYLTDATGPDAAAFHEAFADIVALFQHFTYPDALLATINKTGGLIYKRDLGPSVTPSGESAAIIPELTQDNPLVYLAQQFGKTTGGRSGLRSAIGTPPNSNALATTLEPHARGAILVSAVFDAFFTAYIDRTADLMRLARAGGAVNPQGDLHPTLAQRLAREAAKTASHFMNMCIRALDYCPPVDMTFGEFLRALITADSDLVPDDPHNYRADLIKAFRLRGIIPMGVSSYSEEALRWFGPDMTGRPVGRCTDLEYGILPNDGAAAEAEASRRQERNARALNEFAVANAAALGLDPDPAVKIQPHSFHPVHRINPSGRLVVEFVAELLQQRSEPLDPSVPDSPTFTFRGGSTVVFDDRGEVRYVIQKRIANQSRLADQRDYHFHQLQAPASAPYLIAKNVPAQLNFQLVHSEV